MQSVKAHQLYVNRYTGNTLCVTSVDTDSVHWVRVKVAPGYPLPVGSVGQTRLRTFAGYNNLVADADGASKCSPELPTTKTVHACGLTYAAPKPEQVTPSVGSRWAHNRSPRRVTVKAIKHSRGDWWVDYRTDNGTFGTCMLSSWARHYSPLTIVPTDYTALEQRVMAALDAPDPPTVGKAGQDFHKLRAAEIFDCKPSEVTSAMRRVGKAANLISMYR
ncbi:DNA polymerase I [compost metagenome]